MSFLIEEPGRNYYGLCTFQWVDETEKGPIMFEITIYFVFLAFNIFLCCDVWYSQKYEGSSIHNEDQSQKQAEIEYFQKILTWYFISTTLVGTILTVLNIYAAYETDEAYRSEAILIIHDIVVITQPLLIMILKLDEPLVKREIKKLLKKIKELVISLCSCLFGPCRSCWDRISPRADNTELGAAIAQRPVNA